MTQNPEWLKPYHFQKGHAVPLEWRENLRIIHLGKSSWNKGKKGLQIAWNKGKKLHYKVWNAGLSKETDTRVRDYGQKEKGKIITSEMRQKLREISRGKHYSPLTEIKKGQRISPKTEFKKGQMDLKGEKSPAWKGGVSTINHCIRNSFQYAKWRKAIFERDNYTCQECHDRGGKLHADHIKPFAYYPELRFELNNGRTLCVPCHKQTDTYLKKKKVETDE